MRRPVSAKAIKWMLSSSDREILFLSSNGGRPPDPTLACSEPARVGIIEPNLPDS